MSTDGSEKVLWNEDDVVLLASMSAVKARALEKWAEQHSAWCCSSPTPPSVRNQSNLREQIIGGA